MGGGSLFPSSLLVGRSQGRGGNKREAPPSLSLLPFLLTCFRKSPLLPLDTCWSLLLNAFAEMLL